MEKRKRARRVTKKHYAIRYPELLAELIGELVERAGNHRQLSAESRVNPANVSLYKHGRRSEMDRATARGLVAVALLLPEPLRRRWLDRWYLAVKHPTVEVKGDPFEGVGPEVDYAIGPASARPESGLWVEKLKRSQWGLPPSVLANCWVRLPEEADSIRALPGAVEARVDGNRYACVLGRIEQGKWQELSAVERDDLGWRTLRDLNSSAWRHEPTLRLHLGGAILRAVTA